MEKLQEIAKKIVELEQQCQNGVDIDLNMEKMDEIMSTLTIEEMLTLAALMEEYDLQNLKKYDII